MRTAARHLGVHRDPVPGQQRAEGEVDGGDVDKPGLIEETDVGEPVGARGCPHQVELVQSDSQQPHCGARGARERVGWSRGAGSHMQGHGTCTWRLQRCRHARTDQDRVLEAANEDGQVLLLGRLPSRRLRLPERHEGLQGKGDGVNVMPSHGSTCMLRVARASRECWRYQEGEHPQEEGGGAEGPCRHSVATLGRGDEEGHVYGGPDAHQVEDRAENLQTDIVSLAMGRARFPDARASRIQRSQSTLHLVHVSRRVPRYSHERLHKELVPLRKRRMSDVIETRRRSRERGTFRQSHTMGVKFGAKRKTYANRTTHISPRTALGPRLMLPVAPGPETAGALLRALHAAIHSCAGKDDYLGAAVVAADTYQCLLSMRSSRGACGGASTKITFAACLRSATVPSTT